MLIPIDRPLIDARNIRAAATQTVSGDDVADPALIHNNRATLRITLTGDPDEVHVQGTTVQAIQSGSHIGQRLRIVVVDDGTSVFLRIVDDTATAKTVLRGNWTSGRVESETAGYTYLDLEWNGTCWVEIERYDGVLWNASGRAAHAEGYNNTASGQFSHAEGSDTDATSYNAHAEGAETLASAIVSHAQGYQSIANLYGEHAHAAGRFAANGDAQFIRIVGRKLITMSNVWQDILFLDGTDDLLVIPPNTLFAFNALVAGGESGLAAKKTTYDITRGDIWRDGANNTAKRNATVGGVEDDVSYDLQVIADDTNEALQFQVRDTDNDGVSVRWVAVVWGVMLSFP